ncbi:MAG: hypothetical protein J5669_07190 [Bacteroidales bacterium]|nr:hypothetical protein [Bacteroidales bacterium]
MKTAFRIIVLAGVLALAACQKEDATKDYGFPKVYIPQATVTGIDNSYPVPQGPFYRNSVHTCSYDSASGKLEIILGVMRSGYFSNQQAYSVKLGVSAEETSRKLTELGAGAAQLPQAVCDIPDRISVEAGTSGNTCCLGVDLKALSAQRASFYAGGAYKLLVLGLEISDLQGPADYTLADKNTSVVLVLDLGSEHWDNAPADKPESKVRALFPFD